MFDYLPNNIRAVRDRCWSAETPGGLLRCLPDLFEVLKKEKKSAAYLSQLDKELEAQKQNFQKYCNESVKWMQKCLSSLKSSPFALHPLCTIALKKTEDLIIHRRLDKNQDVVSSELTLKLGGFINRSPYNPLDRIRGFIDAARDALTKAADTVASFGPDPLFDGWAKINTRKVHPHGLEFHFSEDTSGEERLEIHEQRAFAETIGHGVYCWEVEPPRKSFEHNIHQRVYLLTGYLEELIYPDELSQLFSFRDTTGQSVWSELCDSDPVILVAV